MHWQKDKIPFLDSSLSTCDLDLNGITVPHQMMSHNALPQTGHYAADLKARKPSLVTGCSMLKPGLWKVIHNRAMRIPHRVIHVHTGDTAGLLPPSRGTATLALFNKKIKHLTHCETKKICSTLAQYLYSFSLLFKEPSRQASYYVAHKQQWISNVHKIV